MGFGEPKMLTPEEMAEMQKKRIMSDANLVDEGADVTPEGAILPTEKQAKDAKMEMGDEIYEKYQEMGKEIENLNETVNDAVKVLSGINKELYKKIFDIQGGDVDRYDDEDVDVKNGDTWSTLGSLEIESLQDLGGELSDDIKKSNKDTLKYLIDNIKHLQFISDKLNEGYRLAIISNRPFKGRTFTYPVVIKKAIAGNPEQTEA